MEYKIRRAVNPGAGEQDTITVETAHIAGFDIMPFLQKHPSLEGDIETAIAEHLGDDHDHGPA